MADIIDVLQEAYVGLDEFELRTRVELFAFFDDAISCFLRSADDVDSRLDCVFGKCLDSVLADSTRPSDKHGR